MLRYLRPPPRPRPASVEERSTGGSKVGSAAAKAPPPPPSFHANAQRCAAQRRAQNVIRQWVAIQGHIVCVRWLRPLLWVPVVMCLQRLSFTPHRLDLDVFGIRGISHPFSPLKNAPPHSPDPAPRTSPALHCTLAAQGHGTARSVHSKAGVGRGPTPIQWLAQLGETFVQNLNKCSTPQPLCPPPQSNQINPVFIPQPSDFLPLVVS